MHCGHAGNLHDPNCPLMREKSMYFQCSFCGEVGHRPDNCAARNKAYQEQQKGYLCSFCGAMDHRFPNCQIYKESLLSEKEAINQRNVEKYDDRRDTTAKGQEGEYKMQKVKNTRSEEP